VLAASVLTISGIILQQCASSSAGKYDSYVVKNYLWIVVLFNLGCLALCAGMMPEVPNCKQRALLAGVLFTALIITSRFLEYETGLLIKRLYSLPAESVLSRRRGLRIISKKENRK